MRITVFLAAAFALPCILAASQNTTTHNVWDGVYTAQQAVRGEQLFYEKCERCHRGEFFASAEALPLKGPGFMERWREDSAHNLFNRMKGFMPPSPSGGASIKLPDQEYIDIIAFLFQSNTFPPGSSELKPDVLEAVQITGKEGPQPLPNQAMVKVVGCLAEGNNRWNLTKATPPVRTREPEKSTPEELSASAARSLGDQTFELRGLDNLGSFNPSNNAGHKLQVKGVLNRQTAGTRISALSVESLAATCGQ